MARKCRELASFFSRAIATTPLFFTLAPPRCAPPFLVHASCAVTIKVAQVPSTANQGDKIAVIHVRVRVYTAKVWGTDKKLRKMAKKSHNYRLFVPSF